MWPLVLAKAFETCQLGSWPSSAQKLLATFSTRENPGSSRELMLLHSNLKAIRFFFFLPANRMDWFDCDSAQRLHHCYTTGLIVTAEFPIPPGYLRDEESRKSSVAHCSSTWAHNMRRSWWNATASCSPPLPPPPYPKRALVVLCPYNT